MWGRNYRCMLIAGIFLWRMYWGLNLGSHTCYAGTLPWSYIASSHSHSFFQYDSTMGTGKWLNFCLSLRHSLFFSCQKCGLSLHSHEESTLAKESHFAQGSSFQCLVNVRARTGSPDLRRTKINTSTSLSLVDQLRPWSNPSLFAFLPPQSPHRHSTPEYHPQPAFTFLSKATDPATPINLEERLFDKYSHNRCVFVFRALVCFSKFVKEREEDLAV